MAKDHISDYKTVHLGQHLLAFAKWKGHDDQPLQVVEGELPTWHSGMSNVLSCDPSVENPGAASLFAAALGEAELSAIANVNTEDGPQEAGVTILVTVVEKITPTGEIELSHGSIEPVSA